MVANMYQMHPVYKQYASPNYSDLCKTGLMLGEMCWFVAFSGSPLYASVAVIPLQTGNKFILEQYMMQLNDAVTRAMSPHQSSRSVLGGQQYPILLIHVHAIVLQAMYS
ncbi:hypothetical protein TNCV_2565511 [Trichonephila clavipes]|uniref:Uncharacterized protein n=1 Tax=Trichonephila clavipes TaxID=2585209 RepID=A0A8X6VK08_TRICX|nr:hypothetical protein TNCV_2565511 [Trichonephila clavipes]